MFSSDILSSETQLLWLDTNPSQPPVLIQHADSIPGNDSSLHAANTEKQTKYQAFVDALLISPGSVLIYITGL